MTNHIHVFAPVYFSNGDTDSNPVAFTIAPTLKMRDAIAHAALTMRSIPNASTVNLLCMDGIEVWTYGGEGEDGDADNDTHDALEAVLGLNDDPFVTARGDVHIRVYPDGDFALRHFSKYADDMTDTNILRFMDDGSIIEA